MYDVRETTDGFLMTTWGLRPWNTAEQEMWLSHRVSGRMGCLGGSWRLDVMVTLCLLITSRIDVIPDDVLCDVRVTCYRKWRYPGCHNTLCDVWDVMREEIRQFSLWSIFFNPWKTWGDKIVSDVTDDVISRENTQPRPGSSASRGGTWHTWAPAGLTLTFPSAGTRPSGDLGSDLDPCRTSGGRSRGRWGARRICARAGSSVAPSGGWSAGLWEWRHSCRRPRSGGTRPSNCQSQLWREGRQKLMNIHV